MTDEPRRWTTCPTCNRVLWVDTPCDTPACVEAAAKAEQPVDPPADPNP